jgi:hypothetical protein
MKNLASIICRVFFIIAFLLAGLSIWEKLANLIGYTLLRAYSPWRLLEFSVVVVLFIIAIQLREIKILLETKGSD